jgi:hypothetical protein
MAEVGVDVVGEVDRRRARGQVDHAALRREDIDRVLEEPALLRVDPASPASTSFFHASTWRSHAIFSSNLLSLRGPSL